MSGFSPEWLALREPVDHRSRDAALAAQLAKAMSDIAQPSIIDLGCGTGSNLRASAPLLGPRQSWTLVDYDAALLAAARERLLAWADRSEADGSGIRLAKDGRDIRVAFRRADLNGELDAALAGSPHLITASALFDLCSADFITRFAAAVARCRALFFTVLTYDGRQTWTPPHAADAAMLAAFHAHQKTDKGFGASAGPGAPAALAAAFRARGYSVHEGDSPWTLAAPRGAGDRGLIEALATGFAGAVGETAAVPPRTIADWISVTRSGAVTGHTDTLAVPPR